jgi:hypothetical protein
MATKAQQLLPRLLVGVGDRTMTDLDDHLDAHGLLAEPARVDIRAADRAVASRRRPAVVVANGSEGEPASKKDRVLICESCPTSFWTGRRSRTGLAGHLGGIVTVLARAERTLEA